MLEIKSAHVRIADRSVSLAVEFGSAGQAPCTETFNIPLDPAFKDDRGSDADDSLARQP